MTVLGYIRNTTARYKTFVANRIATIHDLTKVSDWHHIDGKLNPADIASRGIMPTDDVKLREWLQGPSFLPTDDYPCEPQNTETDTADDEEPSILVTTTENNVLTDLVERCGKWSKLAHVIMNCFFFCSFAQDAGTSRSRSNTIDSS